MTDQCLGPNGQIYTHDTVVYWYNFDVNGLDFVRHFLPYMLFNVFVIALDVADGDWDAVLTHTATSDPTGGGGRIVVRCQVPDVC